MAPNTVLEVKLISAEGLRTSARFGKPRTYAAAWIRPSKRLYTHVDDEGGCDPAWDDKLWLPVEHHVVETGSGSSAKLTIEIFQRGHVHDHPIGVVEVPIKDVASDLWKPHAQFLTFPVRRASGRTRGVLNLSLKLREQSCSSSSSESSSESESERRRRSAAPTPSAPSAFPSYPPSYSPAYPAPAPVYSPGYPAPASGYYQQPASGYSYQQQSSQPSSRGNAGLALGAGLAAGALGGLVLGEVVEHIEERAAEKGAEEEEAGYYDEEEY